MCHLPINNSILIAGGRNDDFASQNKTRFFNDLTLFLLDQKVWLEVKYTVASERLDYVGNHCLGIVCDHEDYEKVLIFGGITNNPCQDINS